MQNNRFNKAKARAWEGFAKNVEESYKENQNSRNS